MNEVLDFFRGLFKHDQWPPRWKCGNWTDFHGWLYIISDLMIWTAYFLIPLIIIDYFAKKKTAIRFSRVYLLFASFILLCGTTHFLDAIMFWIPMYRFNALVRFITGVVSMFTVYQLYSVLPELFKQRTNLELESEILKREEAEQKLAEANQGLQAFAYIASHDLQEPLRKIRTFAELLYHNNKDKFDQQSMAQAEKIIASGERMQTLILDILALSSIKEEVELADVDTTAVVNKAIEDLDLMIVEKKATVAVGHLPRIKGNEAFLGQLFYNLISNGLKFNDKQPLIKIDGEKKGDTVTITVADNGIGIDEENYKKIFIAFQRLHNKREYEGTGIGLAIVKKIVEVHKATIEVDSKQGEGTTFTMEFSAA